MSTPRRLLILGSIGASTLAVVARHLQRFSVHALTANRNIDKLSQQCQAFNPALAIVSGAGDAMQLQARLRAARLHTEMAYGGGCRRLLRSCIGS